MYFRHCDLSVLLFFVLQRDCFVAERRLQKGYPLDDQVVTAAVKACCRAGRPSEAEAVLAESMAQGLVPEVIACTAKFPRQGRLIQGRVYPDIRPYIFVSQ